MSTTPELSNRDAATPVAQNYIQAQPTTKQYYIKGIATAVLGVSLINQFALNYWISTQPIEDASKWVFSKLPFANAQATGNTVDPVAKAATDKVAEEAARATAEKVTQEAAKVAQEAVNVAAQKAAQEAARVAAENAAQEAARLASENAAAQAGKVAADAAATETIKIATEAATAEAAKIGVDAAAAQAAKTAGDEAAAQAAKAASAATTSWGTSFSNGWASVKSAGSTVTSPISNFVCANKELIGRVSLITGFAGTYYAVNHLASQKIKDPYARGAVSFGAATFAVWTASSLIAGQKVDLFPVMDIGVQMLVSAAVLKVTTPLIQQGLAKVHYLANALKWDISFPAVTKEKSA